MRYLLLALLLSACAKETVFIDTPEYCGEYDRHAYVLMADKSDQKFSHLPVKSECVLAPDTISRSEYRVIHTFMGKNLKLGEFITIDLFQQVTNDTPKPLMVSWYWVQASSPDSIDGIEGFRALGENTDNYVVHHLVTHSKGAWEIKDTTKPYFNFVIYSASGEKYLEGDWLHIDNGYNNVVVERK